MQSPSHTVRDLLTEKFHALLDECDLVSQNAAFGKTLDDLETFFLLQGRTFLKEVFQDKLQERIEQTEANDTPHQCPDCQKKTIIKDIKSKKIVSAHGQIKISRRYHHCSPCKKYSYPVEVTLGLVETYTNSLKRMVARCAGLGSYRLAKDNLAELCQIDLSPTTIGNIADQTSSEIADRLENNPDVRRDFQEAKGETEFYIDGTFVHVRNDDGTTEWREFKLGAFVKRVCGLFALPIEWVTRKLPKPTVVSAFAAIENKEEFQKRCQSERRRLGVGGVTSTLADGAVWIWSLFFWLLGRTAECLDIFHAAEHIAACGKVLFEVEQESQEWFERMRLVLLSEGFAGMERELSLLLLSISKKKKAKYKSVESLLDYFRRNKDRLKYCERLASGRAIGSGLIEGACKNLVGKRLKQTGACWRLPRANRIASLCATLYSDQWKIAWHSTH